MGRCRSTEAERVDATLSRIMSQNRVPVTAKHLTLNLLRVIESHSVSLLVGMCDQLVWGLQA
jgi:hypothetical protein